MIGEISEKEKIYQEIQVRLKERARLNDEIVKLWEKYYDTPYEKKEV